MTWLTFSLTMVLLSVTDLRSGFMQATESENRTNQMFKSLNEKPSRTAIEEGYLAALEGLKAKYALMPISKLSWVESSQKRFRQAINLDPLHYELRFLRLSQEVNLPGFLGYNHMSEDTRILINQLKRKKYPSTDLEHVKMVVRFLIEKAKVSPSDLTWLKNFS